MKEIVLNGVMILFRRKEVRLELVLKRSKSSQGNCPFRPSPHELASRGSK